MLTYNREIGWIFELMNKTDVVGRKGERDREIDREKERNRERNVWQKEN